MKIKANISILHNNVTNCTFIANEIDDKIQTGTRENDSNIEWMGDLSIPIKTTTPITDKNLLELDLPSYENGYYCINENLTVDCEGTIRLDNDYTTKRLFIAQCYSMEEVLSFIEIANKI